MNTPSVYELFRYRSLVAPAAIALEHGREQLSYGGLRERGDRLASRLAACGAGPNSAVAVQLPRGISLVLSVLGVLQSGAAYVPLDPAAPAARVVGAAKTTGARLVVTSGRLAGHWQGTGIEVVDVDEVASLATVDPAAGSLPGPHPEHLACTIFTSGSTGEPKPVRIPHRALTAHCRAVAQASGLTERDRVLQFANPAFDVLVEEVFPTLATGGQVVVAPDPTPVPADLDELIEACDVSVVNLPTPYWEAWIRDLEAQPRPLPTSLRLLVVGSDAAYTSALKRWRAFSKVPVINAYGLTETTITALTASFAAVDGLEREALPIGSALPNVVARVRGRVSRIMEWGGGGRSV